MSTIIPHGTRTPFQGNILPMAKQSAVALRLKRLRERTGLSVRDFAEQIGRGASSYSWYEDGFKKQFLPPDLVKAILPPLMARGIPEADILELGGLVSASSITRQVPDQLPAYTGELAPGPIEIGGTEYTSIGRYDAALSAGPGSLLDPDAEPLGYHLVESQWLHAITTTAPKELAIVMVDGDSMEPTLFDGDWILVDKSQAKFGREGMYALNVYENTWIKRLSVNLAKKLIRIISDNDSYPLQEMPEGDVDIIGRVLSLVSRKL